MADILIRMEMPKENDILVFDTWHGGMYARSTANIGTRSYEVVPLPEGHGRLIDADALREDWLENGENEHVYDTNAMLYSIDNSPTIVPAEGGAEDDGNAS